jgi:hypothetical protein
LKVPDFSVNEKKKKGQDESTKDEGGGPTAFAGSVLSGSNRVVAPEVTSKMIIQDESTPELLSLEMALGPRVDTIASTSGSS